MKPPAPAAADLAARARLRHRRRANRFTWVACLLAAAAAVALAVWLPSLADQSSAPSFRATIASRPELQTLADGSIVHLNAGAEISVAFSPARRDVKLLRGEAHFTVAHDPARPFVVSAGAIAARAIGTEFVVTFTPQNVQILVTKGRVSVASPTLFFLDAGARLTVPLATSASAPAPRLTTLTNGEIARALAWRTRRIELSP